MIPALIIIVSLLLITSAFLDNAVVFVAHVLIMVSASTVIAALAIIDLRHW